MTVRSDTFSRADGALGSNWTASTSGAQAQTMTISGGAAKGSATGGCGEYWSADTFGADQFSQVTLATVPTGGDWIGPAVRVSANSEEYVVIAYPYGNELWLFVNNGGWQSLATYTVNPFNVGDVILLAIAGSAITVTYNGSVVITHTDTQITTGQPGIETDGNSGAVNYWYGGDGSAPSTSVNITGVAAEFDMVGGIGAMPAVNIDGVAAEIVLAGGIGTPTAGTGFSWFVGANGGNEFWTTATDAANWTAYTDVQTAITWEVTEAGYQLSGYYYWWNSAFPALIPGGFALWSTLTSGAGVVVSGSVINSIPTPTITGWQYVALSAPVALTVNTPYKVEFAADGGFFWNNNYTPFASGGGIVNAPLNVYSDQGGSNPIPTTGEHQGSFLTTTNVAGTNYPDEAYESGCPALDVFVTLASTGITITGVAAEIVLAGGVGSVTAGVSVNIMGVAAEFDVDGGIGGVLVGVSADVPGVAAEIVLTGGIGSVTADVAVNISGAAAEIVIAGGTGYGMLQVTFTSTSGGISTYSTFSEINNTGDAGDQDMRVLPPDSPDTSYPHGFLWLLPVEPGQGSTYGDPIATIQALNAQNEYNLTCIQPGFPIDPWYADNPDDAQTKQETFMLELVNWAARTLATGGEKNYIVGFSKSGVGGQQLFFRNPAVFAAIASWDFPVGDMITRFGSDPTAVYGDETNMGVYELSSGNLTAWESGQDYATLNRMWIGAGVEYTGDVSGYDSTLTSLSIEHTYASVSADSHNWAPTPGWVGPAIAAIIGVPVTVTGVAAEIVVAGGIGSVTADVSVDIPGVSAETVLAGGIGSVTASSDIPGVSAETVLAGGIGSVTASSDIPGVSAETVLAGGIGSATASSDIPGVSAETVLAGGIGSATASSDVPGVAAEIVMAGGVGSVSVSASVSVPGVAAEIDTYGGIGEPVTSVSVNISGVAAEIILTGTLGSLIASANVPGSGAVVIFAGTPGSVTALTTVVIQGQSAIVIFAGGRGLPPGPSAAKPSKIFMFSQL